MPRYEIQLKVSPAKAKKPKSVEQHCAESRADINKLSVQPAVLFMAVNHYMVFQSYLNNHWDDLDPGDMGELVAHIEFLEHTLNKFPEDEVRKELKDAIEERERFDKNPLPPVDISVTSVQEVADA